MLHVPRMGAFEPQHVRDLPRHFAEGDVLVLNDSRVQPVSLVGTKETGGKVEALVLEALPDGSCLALLRSSRPPASGTRLRFGSTSWEVSGRRGMRYVLRPSGPLDLPAAGGRPPLPPYIRREADDNDVERYQCLHAREDAAPPGTPGASAAAPTAGLHLTPSLLADIEAAGARVARVTLGVGLGTFRPVDSPRVEDHLMHDEPFEVSEHAAAIVDGALREGRRVTAVGTTTLRALEAACTAGGRVRPVTGRTGLFLVPGSRLRTATRLLTNFHQPRTTLLALAQAFAGRERAMAAHAEAVRMGWGLFSYGDCMLVERAA